MLTSRPFLTACLAWLTLCGWPRFAAADESIPIFERDIAPIFKLYCWNCHGAGGRAGGLDLRSLPLIREGGDSGPVLVPGNADHSLLYRKLAQAQMPPAKTQQKNVVYSALKPLPEQVQRVRQWIDAGARAQYTHRKLTTQEEPVLTDVDRQWWAFQTPRSTPPPRVQAAQRVRTPIDRFLLRQLEQRQLTFSPDADRGDVLQRLHLDLTGLPATAAQVRAFQRDPDPLAYEKRVDQLLSSPAFGERWGRHWLDAAGYVDTFGKDNDAGIINVRKNIWRYRDYVVDALNSDLAFDRFVTEQLAGDELSGWNRTPTFTPETRRLLIATGFLRQAVDSTNSKELNTADIRNSVLLDTVQIVSSNLLGMTLHCAQCHSHKFDPISQADYYRFAAIFAPALNRQNWKHPDERHLYDVSLEEKRKIDQHNAQVQEQVKQLQGKIKQQRDAVRQTLLTTRYETLPAPIRDDTRQALSTPKAKRTGIQKYLAEKLGPQLAVSDAQINNALDAADRDRIAAQQAQIASLSATRQSYAPIQALWEFAAPPRFYLFRRGEFERPGPIVQAGIVAVMDRTSPAFEIPQTPPGAASSGYRSALANWLTNPDHPLLARVFVNRVWQQYFGRGIVETPDNFGASGVLPTHPELLDWLARDFIDGGWSVKRLHRLIVSSSAYRQTASSRSIPATSAAIPDPAQRDPQNVWLWRMPVRRLESEAIRDRILAVSGRLNRHIGGPPIPLAAQPDGSVIIDTKKLKSAEDRFCRSIYVLARRNYQLTQLSVFDQPVVTHNCTRRDSSSVVLQSLNMLNSGFLIERGQDLAARVSAEVGLDNRPAQVTRTFQSVLSRDPSKEEAAWCAAFLEQQAQRYPQTAPAQAADARRAALGNLAHMLLNTNEFLYIP